MWINVGAEWRRRGTAAEARVLILTSLGGVRSTAEDKVLSLSSFYGVGLAAEVEVLSFSSSGGIGSATEARVLALVASDESDRRRNLGFEHQQF